MDGTEPMTFKNELIEIVREGLLELGLITNDDWGMASNQAVNIVEGLFTRIENAERKASQEKSWADTQGRKLDAIRQVIKEREERFSKQGRYSTSPDWLTIKEILDGIPIEVRRVRPLPDVRQEHGISGSDERGLSSSRTEE